MATDTLRRIHSFTGLFPLGAYLLFHAWEHWPIRLGRDPALERLARTGYVPLEIGLIVLPLLAHAGLGVVLARRPEARSPYLSPSFRRLQAATGVATLLFLAFHLVGVWLPGLFEPTRPIVVFDAMQAQAGTLLGAALHVFALGCVCTHFGQGLGAALIRHGHDVPPRLARAMGVLFGVCLWLALVNELSVYAAGAALM